MLEQGIFQNRALDWFVVTSEKLFNKVEHLLVCKQSKRGVGTPNFYSYFVMVQL
jgi:hypothetical protein